MSEPADPDAVVDEAGRIAAARRQWEQRVPPGPREPGRPVNSSGIEADLLYTPADAVDYLDGIGFPGQFPFTRGIHATMYRGRLWTQRQIAGFGGASETNARYRFLLDRGMTGLSTDFDHPTLTGHDSDDALSAGEVGRIGVAIDTVEDMSALYAGIPLDRVSLSLTINHPAPVLLAMLLVSAEERGIAPATLTGTTQNDPLKEFYSQKTFIFEPRAALRLMADVVEFCVRHAPRWNAVSVCGGHTREAGANAVQELAFTLADGIAYLQEVLARGITADQAAPSFSFLLNVHSDFFEEVAKLRAARRMWAHLMRDRFGATDPASCRLRVHTQTGCDTLTAQQPQNNIIRGTLQALAAVLGGTQSMHVNGMDEALSIPTEHAMEIALRTQQIIAHESGVTHTVDPLAGSYYVEWLTDEMERRAWGWLEEIDRRGGMLACVESGLIEQVIADEAYRYQQEVQAGDRVIVGVNRYTVEEDGPDIETFRVDPASERAQVERLRQVRASRDARQVEATLEKVRIAADSTENLMPSLIEAVRARATEGEVIGAMKDVFGEHQPQVVF